MVRPVDTIDEAQLIYLLSAWKVEIKNPPIRPYVVNLAAYLQTLVKNVNSTLLVLDNWRGIMGLVMMPVPYNGSVFMAHENFWYIHRDHRSLGIVNDFIKAAENWALDNGCKFLSMSASVLANEDFEKVCKLYEHKGLTLHEKSYMKELSWDA